MSFFGDMPRVTDYDKDLGWIICQIKKLRQDVDEMEICCEDVQKRLTALEEWVNSFDDSYIEEVVSRYLATAIFVSISDAGYIIYHIPKTWQNLDFRTTGLDVDIPIMPEYGHLVLYY